MNKTRPNRVYFRVTDEELEKINQCVSASGLTRQEWLLSVVTPNFETKTEPGKVVVTPTETCPLCGSELIVRNGRKGKFWGCSSFPKCRFSKDWQGD